MRVEPNWRIPTPPVVALHRHRRGADRGGSGEAARAASGSPCRGVLAVLLTLLIWHPFPPEIAKTNWR
jgi:hypothetical protein